jgi:hypothetical protein
VNAAGPREIALRVSQLFWKRKQCVDPDSNIPQFKRCKTLPDCVDARLAAKPTATRNRSKPLGRGKLYVHSSRKLEIDSVVGTYQQLLDVPPLADNCFGE